MAKTPFRKSPTRIPDGDGSAVLMRVRVKILPGVPTRFFRLQVGSAFDDYSGWSAAQDWAGGDNSVTGNPDLDPFENLMEYALDLNPSAYDSTAGFPQPGTDTQTAGGPWLTFTYRKNTSAKDLTYVVSATTNFVDWGPLEIDGVNAVEEVADPNPDGDGSAILMRVRVKLVPGSPPRFLRLEVNL